MNRNYFCENCEQLTEWKSLADRMALILSDGLAPSDEVCCVDYFRVRDVIFDYHALLKKYNRLLDK